MGAGPRKHNDPQPGSGIEYIDTPLVANLVLEGPPTFAVGSLSA